MNLESLRDKIESRISRTETCWNWIGYVSKSGYGRLSVYDGNKTKVYQAHRIVYELYKGKIPPKLQIDHLCRNRRCVNPKHLEAVDARTNIERGIGVTAKNMKKTHCKCGKKYDYSFPGSGYRKCKSCMREEKRRYRIRNVEKIRNYHRNYWRRNRSKYSKQWLQQIGEV